AARGLAAIFDGVGYGPGQVAARMAVRCMRRGWRQLHLTPTLAMSDEHDFATVLQQIIVEANQQIIAEGARRREADPDARLPETTCFLAVFSHLHGNKGYLMTYAHVGDSRLYLLRGNDPLQRLTNDDGYLSLKLKDGSINEEDALRIDQASAADQL